LVTTGLLDEEVGQELGNLDSLLGVVGLDSPLEGVLLGVELGSVDGVLTTLDGGHEVVTQHVGCVGNSVEESIQGGIFSICMVLDAPVVVIVEGGFVLGVHFQVKRVSRKHSALVGGVVKGSGDTLFIINFTEDVTGEIGNESVDQFKTQTSTPNREVNTIIIRFKTFFE